MNHSATKLDAIFALLGPNGAGKTTLLNIIAGLTDYDGSVLFDGMPVDKVPASKREAGYLFQDLVLFPHLDVTANIAYGLKVQKQSQSEVEARVQELLQVMRIKHLSSRYPKHLSGGEKQRVALARALALSPKVLLLDEPLNSLDVQTSKYLRIELKQLQRELGITTIYVTHDLTEAEELAEPEAMEGDTDREWDLRESAADEAAPDAVQIPGRKVADEIEPERATLAAATVLPLSLLGGKRAWVWIVVLVCVAIAGYLLIRWYSGRGRSTSLMKEASQTSSGDPVRDFLDNC